jgi:hypothetical protein
LVDDVIHALNENAGVVAAFAALVSAFATVVYALITVGLLREAQSERLSAELVASPELWQLVPDALIVTLSNHGRAPALGVTVERVLRAPGGRIVESSIHKQPAMAPNEQRRFLPERSRSASSLAADGLVLELSWSWTDGKRNRRGPIQQERMLVMTVQDIVDGFRGGASLLEPEVPREIVKIREALQSTQKSIAEQTRLMKSRRASHPRNGRALAALGRIVASLRRP